MLFGKPRLGSCLHVRLNPPILKLQNELQPAGHESGHRRLDSREAVASNCVSQAETSYPLARVFQGEPYLDDDVHNHRPHHSALPVAELETPQRDPLPATRPRFWRLDRKCTETPRLHKPPRKESPTCLAHFLTVLTACRVPCCPARRGRESEGPPGRERISQCDALPDAVVPGMNKSSSKAHPSFTLKELLFRFAAVSNRCPC